MTRILEFLWQCRDAMLDFQYNPEMQLCTRTFVHKNSTNRKIAMIFMKQIFVLHGLPWRIVFDHNLKFTSKFWKATFEATRTSLAFNTTYLSQTIGQANRESQSIYWRYAISLLYERSNVRFLNLIVCKYDYFDYFLIIITSFFISIYQFLLVFI